VKVRGPVVGRGKGGENGDYSKSAYQPEKSKYVRFHLLIKKREGEKRSHKRKEGLFVGVSKNSRGRNELVSLSGRVGAGKTITISTHKKKEKVVYGGQERKNSIGWRYTGL